MCYKQCLCIMRFEIMVTASLSVTAHRCELLTSQSCASIASNLPEPNEKFGAWDNALKQPKWQKADQVEFPAHRATDREVAAYDSCEEN